MATLSSDNAHKPPPRWFRKLEKGVCMILIPAAIPILQGAGLNGAIATKWQLFLTVGVVALFKFVGTMLANGEDYTEKPEV